jgi:hypothetical protein
VQSNPWPAERILTTRTVLQGRVLNRCARLDAACSCINRRSGTRLRNITIYLLHRYSSTLTPLTLTPAHCAWLVTVPHGRTFLHYCPATVSFLIVSTSFSHVRTDTTLTRSTLTSSIHPPHLDHSILHSAPSHQRRPESPTTPHQQTAMDRCSLSPAIMPDTKAPSLEPPRKVRRATTAGIR